MHGASSSLHALRQLYGWPSEPSQATAGAQSAGVVGSPFHNPLHPHVLPAPPHHTPYLNTQQTGMFSDPEFAVRSQVVDKRGRLLGEGGRQRKADEAIKR